MANHYPYFTPSNISAQSQYANPSMTSPNPQNYPQTSLPGSIAPPGATPKILGPSYSPSASQRSSQPYSNHSHIPGTLEPNLPAPSQHHSNVATAMPIHQMQPNLQQSSITQVLLPSSNPSLYPNQALDQQFSSLNIAQPQSFASTSNTYNPSQPQQFQEWPSPPPPHTNPNTTKPQLQFNQSQPWPHIPHSQTSQYIPMSSNPSQMTPAAQINTSTLIVPCPTEFIRLTLNSIPNTTNLAKTCQIPIGVIIQPLAELSPNSPPVAIIDTLSSEIERCGSCRSYLNPFAKFVENGRRWQCCFCEHLNLSSNDTLSATMAGKHYNPNQPDNPLPIARPQITNCAVDYLAPASYASRPPIPPTYLFLIDVSYYSVKTGILQIVANALMQLLPLLPGGNSTKVCMMAFDSKIRYFDFTEFRAHILVHSNVKDLFLPPGRTFLVNRNEHLKVMTDLLKSLHTLFQDTKDVQSCLGAALLAAHMVLKPIGGKLIVLTGLLPTSSRNNQLGPGRLVDRFDPKMLGTDKENDLVKPQADGQWYKQFAIDCTKDQISIDLFLFDHKMYLDVSTLSQLPVITAGQLYYYPNWRTETDGEKMCRDLEHNLLRTCGWEAVMRLRCSHGIRISSSLGNLLVKTSDLVVLCSIDSDKACSFHLTLSNNLINVSHVFLQTALLYSNSSGERIIRVFTIAIPTSYTLNDLYRTVDCEATVTLTGKLALEWIFTRQLTDAKEMLTTRCVNIMAANQRLITNFHNRSLPESLQALPLLILALIKSPALRGTNVHPDIRASAITLLQMLPVDLFIQFLYPTMYRMYPLEPQFGLPNEGGQIQLPPILNLISATIDRKGIFLLDNGQQILIWFGKEVSSDVIYHLFDVQELSKVIPIKQNDSDTTSLVTRFNNILQAIRSQNSCFQKVTYIAEGTPMSNMWLDYLIEDRVKSLPSYHEFTRILDGHLSKLINSKP